MTKIFFVQPFTVNAELAKQCEGRTIVLDVAFNAGSPQGKGTPKEQYEQTTQAFIDALDDTLVLWIDHHPHTAWAQYGDDTRFLLVPRDQAPSCPPLITPALYERYGVADTIVCHGDIDGIFSAIKYTLGGREAYSGADLDSNAIDSRVGTPSALAQYYDEALKANLRDDRIRHAIYEIYTSFENTSDAHDLVENAAYQYQEIQKATEAISNGYSVYGKVAYVSVLDETVFDLTALLLVGQKKAEVAIVEHFDGSITIASHAKWDFATLFGILGGMKNRVTLPSRYSVHRIIAQINK